MDNIIRNTKKAITLTIEMMPVINITFIPVLTLRCCLFALTQSTIKRTIDVIPYAINASMRHKNNKPSITYSFPYGLIF